MNKNQIEVIKWWHSDHNYQSGVALLTKFAKNKRLISTLFKPGKEKFGGKRKLDYELAKSVGLNWKNIPPLTKFSEKDKSSGITVPGNNLNQEKLLLTPTVMPADFEPEYPEIIRRIKYLYSELYKKRSISHRKMRDVDSANTNENTTLRASLLQVIKHVSKKLDFYFSFISKFETDKTVPEEEKVFPPETKPKKLPNNLKDLIRMQKNLRWTIIRNANTLLYQNRSKQSQENPLPAGPKRDRLKAKVVTAKKELNIVNKKIDKLQSAKS